VEPHLLYPIRLHGVVKVKSKSKVVPVLLTDHHAMKAYWGWRYSSTHSLTSALDGDE
jgi:predicted SPOUT superfamily RNA methylase MTH1